MCLARCKNKTCKWRPGKSASHRRKRGSLTRSRSEERRVGKECRSGGAQEKQKTAYEMVSDWSSDVCSSDLAKHIRRFQSALSQFRLWLDPAKLAERGLTATNVLSALQEQNVQVAAGQIGQPPSQEGQSYQIKIGRASCRERV